jgi:hypothetical protein
MRTRILISFLIALALVAAAASARAQSLESPRARQGYYVALGGHGGVVASSDEGDTRTLIGGGGTLRLGQLFTSRLGLGLRIDTSVAGGEGFDGSAGGLGIEGQVNLWRELTLHGGVGLGFVSVTDPDDPDAEDHGGYGAVYSAALTYDLFFTDRLTGGWALSPAVRLNALPSDDFDAVQITFGVELTWWSGRPETSSPSPKTSRTDADGRSALAGSGWTPSEVDLTRFRRGTRFVTLVTRGPTWVGRSPASKAKKEGADSTERQSSSDASRGTTGGSGGRAAAAAAALAIASASAAASVTTVSFL